MVNIINNCISLSKNIKKILYDNPEYHLLFLCGDNCYRRVGLDDGYTINTGDYEINEITIIDENTFKTKDELTESIYCDVCSEHGEELSADYYNRIIQVKLQEYTWYKVIIVTLHE